MKFGGPDFSGELFEISKRIRTYTEQLHGQVEEDIKAALCEAQFVMLLGFGFHSQNMALLTGAIQNNDGIERKILGSVYKIDPENHEQLRLGLIKNMGGDSQTVCRLLDMKSAQIFEQLRPVINMYVN